MHKWEQIVVVDEFLKVFLCKICGLKTQNARRFHGNPAHSSSQLTCQDEFWGLADLCDPSALISAADATLRKRERARKQG